MGKGIPFHISCLIINQKHMAESLFKKLSWKKQRKNTLGTLCFWPLTTWKNFQIGKNKNNNQKIAEQKIINGGEEKQKESLQKF